MKRSHREFGCERAFHDQGQLFVDGRCYEDSLSVGDIFRQLYRLAPIGPRTEMGWEWELSESRRVNLRIDEILFCGKNLDSLPGGYTARLRISGQGEELVRNDHYEVLGIEQEE